MINKWSGYTANVKLKADGPYVLQSEDGLDTSGSFIVSFEREKLLHVQWKDTFNPKECFDLRIQLMPCKSDTEYCSELHLMFKHSERHLTEDESKFYAEYFELMFEGLRKYQNKDWVIQDSDLSMSYLTGSKL